MFHLDKKGQANFIGLGVTAIVGVLVIIIFAEFYAGANTTNISSGAQNVLDLTDLILAGAIAIFLLGGMAYAFRGR